MSMTTGASSGAMGEINVTPMIDILLVLNSRTCSG